MLIKYIRAGTLNSEAQVYTVTTNIQHNLKLEHNLKQFIGKCRHIRISQPNNNRRDCSTRTEMSTLFCIGNVQFAFDLSLPVSLSPLTPSPLSSPPHPCNLSLPVRCALNRPSTFETSFVCVHTFSSLKQVITFFLPPGLLE